MSLGVIIGGKLTSSNELAAIVGTKVYPHAIDEAVALPAVIYKINSTIPTYTKDGLEYDVSNVSVISFATSYETALSMTSAIRAALELFKGTYTGASVTITSSRIESITEGFDFENNVYTIQTTFEIKNK